METFIGFVVGYLVGVREGKDGAQRLKTSLGAIISSPETHKLVAGALAVAGPMAKKASGGGIGGSVVRELIERAVGTREESRAA